MGKSFVCSCPECGAGLMFSTGLFAKKSVKCSCGRVITVKEAIALKEEQERVMSAPSEPTPVVEKPRVDPSIFANDYTVRLDEEVLRALEGTEDELWFLNANDPRSKEELHADFEAYFKNDLLAGYQIVQNYRPEELALDPACKPINFMFYKDGDRVLAVNIVPYTGISHPAIKNVKIECEERGINYVHFIVGYPNKEHYVVRRVLEELGEVRRFYN